MSEITYWQVAAGSIGRYYPDAFIRFGMAFVGGDTQIQNIKNVKTGDRIILKKGLSEILAVGEIIERDGRATGCNDKEWLRDFDGWDLSGYCFVRWHVPQEPITTKGFTPKAIEQVHETHLKELAENIISELPPKTEYDAEPYLTRQVDDDEILEMLIREGLSPSAVEDISATFVRIRRLAHYYYTYCNWGDIREHETRTFLIIPLLQALGWAEQQMKIELGINNLRVDIAFFLEPYRSCDDDSKCVLVLESKGFEQGLTYAHDQAKDYAKEFPKCKTIVVSNGYCYKGYKSGEDGVFKEEPHAYLNLLMPRDRYPLNPQEVDGALAMLKLLLPRSH